MREKPIAATLLAMAVLAPQPAPRACTTFCLSDGTNVVFGRNYDFDIGDGLIVVNKRDVAKVSTLGAPGDHVNAARWLSRYGSLTFNQYGREFPTGGMNERGLVVELMWLDETVYPPPDARPVVSVLEWIQYQLDTRASVADLLAHAAEIRVRGRVPLHYLVADPTGAAATIEFLDGRLLVHEGKSLPVRALTNDTYRRSLSSLERYGGSGADPMLPQGPGSLERFARTAAMLERYPGSASSPISEYAFDVLRNAAQGDRTRWSIVYDLKDLGIRFRTWSHPEIRSLRFSSFDFSCSTPVRILDVNAAAEGDVTHRFADYTYRANLDLVTRSYRQVSFLTSVPMSEIESIARHPDDTHCAQGKDAPTVGGASSK